MGYDIFEYIYLINIIFFKVVYSMRYVISYLYLICEINKNNNIKYILFLIFKIKMISHANIFYLKK